jgi:chromate transporter
MNIYLQIFTCFAKIGAFTIGGGYAMIPIIEREVVKRKKWMDEQDFMDVLAISQSAPGLLAVNISIFLGYRLRGLKGSIIATLGSILPSFIIILLIAMFFTGYQDNPTVVRVFKGIRPVVVALIAVPVINMAKKAKLNLYTGFLAAITCILILFLKVSPVYILMTVGVIFTIISFAGHNKVMIYLKSKNSSLKKDLNNSDNHHIPTRQMIEQDKRKDGHSCKQIKNNDSQNNLMHLSGEQTHGKKTTSAQKQGNNNNNTQ